MCAKSPIARALLGIEVTAVCKYMYMFMYMQFYDRVMYSVQMIIVSVKVTRSPETRDDVQGQSTHCDINTTTFYI